MGYGWSMQTTRSGGRLAVGLAVVGALVVTAAACDGDANGDPDADEMTAELTVVVTHPDHETIEYQLTCGATDAEITGDETGVDAAAACEALTDEAVLDRLVLGVPTGRICAEVFGGPDVASISGVIDETPIATIVDRTNACMIEDWDELLGDLLPPPRGEVE